MCTSFWHNHFWDRFGGQAIELYDWLMVLKAGVSSIKIEVASRFE